MIIIHIHFFPTTNASTIVINYKIKHIRNKIFYDCSMAPVLRKVEKEVLIPRYMEYKINHELCHEESRLFAECAGEKGLKVVVDCRAVLKKFEICSNRWWRDEEFRKKSEEEYIQKRAHFRKTGEAERSPFKRL